MAPYDRPPLSKGSLAGDGAPFFRPEGWYAEHGVALLRGARAVRLHAGRRMLELADGSRLRYDDLLIATGSVQCLGNPAGAHAELSTGAGGRGFEAVYRRRGRVSAVLLAGRPAAALRAARRLLTPDPELERSAA